MTYQLGSATSCLQNGRQTWRAVPSKHLPLQPARSVASSFCPLCKCQQTHSLTHNLTIQQHRPAACSPKTSLITSKPEWRHGRDSIRLRSAVQEAVQPNTELEPKPEWRHSRDSVSLESAVQEAVQPITELAPSPAGTPEEQPGEASDAEASEAKQAELDQKVLRREAARRRNFAIIAHADAGKSSLTEKLLLYGGAIHEAGAVKARRASRHVTSDWMELEKQRGISITSTAMTFDYDGFQMNLLDTPGHQDFSEDTYRTLAAADNAVMLMDGAKGIEAQTRKLFEVVRLRKLPIFTFVNKLDRPALEPMELMDQLEKEFGLQAYPVNWPIGSGDRFVGVYHRPSKLVYLFERSGRDGRSRRAQGTAFALDDPQLDGLVEADLLAEVRDEIELLDELGEELDMERVMRGELTPVFFGSAMNNFGVELFLQSFTELAASPAKRSTHEDVSVRPDDVHFSGLVFKLQANMDPRHRDKVAFIRVCSGKFEKGMKVKIARTGRTVALSRPQKMFAQDRTTVQEGFAGDVIGLNNPGAFAIGDTIFTGPAVRYPPIPSFSPELFAYLRCTPGQKKAFQKGLDGLLGEGAVQVLYSNDDFVTDPMLAAVGQLQFEVVQHRMKAEYGVDTTLEPLAYSLARWVLGGWDCVARAGRLFNTTVAKDVYGRPVLLFRNEFALQQITGDAAKALGELSPYAIPPDF